MTRTQSFADAVAAAIALAEQGQGNSYLQEYLGLLDELTSGLKQQGIGAKIVTGSDPRRLSLYVYPRYRPSRGSLMLSFFLNGTGIVASGLEPKTLSNAGEFEEFLLDFVKLPAFVASVQHLREVAEEPVEGRLGVDQERAYAMGDVQVSVTPEQQEEFANAADGQAVALRVQRIDFPGNAAFDSGRTYEVFESAGIVAQVVDVTLDGSDLVINCTRKVAGVSSPI